MMTGNVDSRHSPSSECAVEKGSAIRFVLMEENGDWKSLTEFLHEAYREHALAGRHYKASFQTVEQTKERCLGNTCLLAMQNGVLAGTITMEERRKKGVPYGYVMQVAVSPQCRKLGLGRRLLEEVERMAKERGYACLSCDTAESAVKLVDWYLRQGWRKVSCTSHKETNYFSTVLQKDWANAPSIPGWKYGMDWLKCHLLWRPDGKLRIFGTVVKAIRDSLRAMGIGK